MHGKKKGLFLLTCSVFSHLMSTQFLCPCEFWDRESLLHETLTGRADVKAYHSGLMQQKLRNH